MTVVFSSYLRKKLEQGEPNSTANRRSGATDRSSERRPKRRLTAGALLVAAIGAMVVWRRRRKQPATVEA